ncbi:Uncharacterised protein [Vibrio cholerae]|nr:Uncharacterised protein [Vibrio cholerae]CSH90906.1 Uncharacterised protein [Vibrio cholerae]CSI67017.1 Uncharacterised protein [Vibrio cholerae]
MSLRTFAAACGITFCHVSGVMPIACANCCITSVCVTSRPCW